MDIVQMPATIAQTIRNIFTSDECAWYYTDKTCHDSVGCAVGSNTKDSPQFTHVMLMDGIRCSTYYKAVEPIILELERQFDRPFKPRAQRIKANLLMQDSSYPEGAYHTPHVDHMEPVGAESFVYYVNESDGDTTFFINDNGLQVSDKVSPMMGSGVLFNSNTYHASSSPIHSTRRIVLNFVFSPDKKGTT